MLPVITPPEPESNYSGVKVIGILANHGKAIDWAVNEMGFVPSDTSTPALDSRTVAQINQEVEERVASRPRGQAATESAAQPKRQRRALRTAGSRPTCHPAG